MHDPEDERFWSQRTNINITLAELMTLHGNLLLALCEPTVQPEESTELLELCETFEVILIRTGAMTKDEIDEAHEEIDESRDDD